MSLYQKPYYIMMDAAERAIEQLEECNVGTAKAILIKGERDAEEAYVSAGERSGMETAS